ncbi:uncharacterized protein LOC102369608 [Alligator sinensis]|uniref:Uncharacterized protein LOC102369608 n=1 Tax=Alligator sinensis TaxID=38654 RepID=A0A1U7SKE6_ALLSI|nr:uncharacterized protein LOC102369608 [Alligator sinensis]XP_014382108.1 uncharacterized protein LOC102369608 [Alligator sinensis]XP_025049557.1 uncharacterized protein LOC102369608 [Alligator sinensis]
MAQPTESCHAKGSWRQLEQETLMGKRLCLQLWEAFEAMAVYFTQEEWELLEDVQKGLYQDQMLRNCGALIFLGKDVSCSPRLFVAQQRLCRPFLLWAFTCYNRCLLPSVLRIQGSWYLCFQPCRICKVYVLNSPSCSILPLDGMIAFVATAVLITSSLPLPCWVMALSPREKCYGQPVLDSVPCCQASLETFPEKKLIPIPLPGMTLRRQMLSSHQCVQLLFVLVSCKPVRFHLSALYHDRSLHVHPCSWELCQSRTHFIPQSGQCFVSYNHPPHHLTDKGHHLSMASPCGAFSFLLSVNPPLSFKASIKSLSSLDAFPKCQLVICHPVPSHRCFLTTPRKQDIDVQHLT